MHRWLVLASASRARARLAGPLAEALDADLALVPSGVDERAFDDRFDPAVPGDLAVALARAKATAVAERLSKTGDPVRPGGGADVRVVGADQLLVVPRGPTVELLHQPGTVERAVEQLCRLAGTTHDLVNGLAVIDPVHGTTAVALDVQRVTMRAFDRDQAERYVARHRPLDCVGAYRLEDDAGLVTEVVGEDGSGVLGLPVPALGRLLGRLGWPDAEAAGGRLSQSVRWSPPSAP